VQRVAYLAHRLGFKGNLLSQAVSADCQATWQAALALLADESIKEVLAWLVP